VPRLILEARRVASTVIHGLHGRRRAGPGENFWQYRRFVSGEPAQNVDWRRSARDDHLYVREREWEASHTVWIWPDRSPSMTFASALSTDSKVGAHWWWRCLGWFWFGGERVAFLDFCPTASRSVIEKMRKRSAIPPSVRACHRRLSVPAVRNRDVVRPRAPIGALRT
jgi:hypothetical protein